MLSVKQQLLQAALEKLVVFDGFHQVGIPVQMQCVLYVQDSATPFVCTSIDATRAEGFMVFYPPNSVRNITQ